MRILLTLLLLSAQLAFAQADFNVFEASITDLQEALSEGNVTSVQLVNQYIERIQALTGVGRSSTQLSGLTLMQSGAPERLTLSGKPAELEACSMACRYW